MVKGKAPRVRTRTYTKKPQGQVGNEQILFYGGLVAVAGIGAGLYFWMTGVQAREQAQQQLTAQQQAGQPQAIANAQAISPGFGVPGIPPGTAAVTVGAVNPLGAFNTIFPFFGGSTFFTLTRRSCDPFIGGVPTQADLASQGIIITSYQVNNIGGPVTPAVCGVPVMSITVGVTDPASGVKLQALGFIPGTFGGGFLGGLWPKGIGPTPVWPPSPVPTPRPPVMPLPFPVPFPPAIGTVGVPVPPPGGFPFLKIPALWTLAGGHKRHGRHHDGRDRHDRDDRHERDKIHFIGLPKHNFIRPVGHVINFATH